MNTAKALALWLGISALAMAQSTKPLPPNEQWKPLFNGKDLAGFVNVGSEKWTVEEGGIIHGQGVSKEYGYLRTETRYKDFELALQFKCEGPGNSGVFFHVEFDGNRPEVKQGLQFDIDKKVGNHTGGIYGDGRKWIVWPSPEKEAVLRPNDWNHYLMRVDGNRYMAWLNGVLMVDFTDPDPKSFDGYIALQLHSGGAGDMRFKDLFLRDLTRR